MDGGMSESIQSMIDRVGWAVIAVHGTEDEPAISYTVGLWGRFRHPELVIVGSFHPATAQGVLNSAGALIREGKRLTSGVYDGIVRNYHVGIQPIPPVNRMRFAVARRLYGDDFEIGQLFLPDRDGRLPGDPACNARMAAEQVDLTRINPASLH